MKKLVLSTLLFAHLTSSHGQDYKTEPHRPQFHFSPKKNWMNDPNGMVYYNGVYHLFFQHTPFATTPDFARMHWGHAVSKDLIHWQELDPAIAPDEYGAIFSGGAVADVNNTSGFAKNAETPLVAIYTQHDMAGEKSGRNDFQNQSIAYSLDEGKTWKKYEGNPVIKNPGIKDFRDPKVFWYEPQKKWVMALATKDCVTFYSSHDLKTWNKVSAFGQETGAHGGVWECPDLFPLEHYGKQVWVLLVSMNPGGPNGGSATQYFLGDFDGNKFTPFDKETRWMDYGTDNYAGVTFANTGNKTILMGWMNNWQYAQVVPTSNWRGATTLPRELTIKTVNNKMFLASYPVKAFDQLLADRIPLQKIKTKGSYDLSTKTGAGVVRLDITDVPRDDFSIVLSSDSGDKLVVGYDQTNNLYYIDRTQSGKTDFEPGFAKRHTAPRIVSNTPIKLTLIADAASVELFADDGLTVMTDVFFPKKAISNIQFRSARGISMNNVKCTRIKAALQL
jgi:fructan beta-fructosidase